MPSQRGEKDKEEEKRLKEQKELELKNKLQKKKLEVAYFKISEIEKDYNTFKEKHFSLIDTTVMSEIAKFCKYEQISFKDLFFKDSEDAEKFRYRTNIHVYELYELESDVSELEKIKQEDSSDKDFKPLFSLFALKFSKEDKTVVPFNAMFTISMGEKIRTIYDGLSDEWLEKSVDEDNRRILISYLAETTH